MDPITVGSVVFVLASSLVLLIQNYRNRIKDQDIRMQQVVSFLEVCEKEAENTRQQYEQAYEHESCDDRMIGQCRDLLNKFCPQGIEQKFAELNKLEARKDFLSKLAEQAAEIMQVAPLPVSFEEMPMQKYGNYSMGENVIFLNELYVLESPLQIVDTIFHELKHAVQCKAMTDNPWNYSAKIRGLWKVCFERYYSGIFYEAYATQAIEIDARHFANEVINKSNQAL